MHLPVLSSYGAIGLQYHGSIVIDSGRTTLEKRQDNHDAQFARQGAECFSGGAGNGFGQVAQLGILFLAEVQTVVQLLQHHQLGTLCGCLPDIALQAGDIIGDIRRTVLLHHANAKLSHYL